MAKHGPATPPAFEVGTAAGVPIAVWVTGEGPPMVLVHGSIADHKTFDELVGELARDFTTYAMDRRGSGASGDADPYAIEDEFDDVAAVVDEVADRAGVSVVLWGHSYGANCAMGGADRSSLVARLVLYEPSLGLTYPPDAIAAVESALRDGDRETAIRRVLVDILELGDDEVDELRAHPLWPTRLAAAHTIPRECHAEEDWTYRPGQFAGITAPTLMLSGSASVPEIVRATQDAADAIPVVQVLVLEGHGHLAHKADPAYVAALVRAFAAESAAL